MRRRSIALDWDDTLVDYNGGFVLFHNQHHGTNLTYEDIHSHEMPKVYGCEYEDVLRRTIAFRNSPGFRDLKPMPGSADAVRHLRRIHDLHVVTNRAESFRGQTIEDAVRHFGNPFTGMHFANGFGAGPGVAKRPKSEACIAIEAAVLVEDAPVHAKEVASHGFPVLMPHRPWNKDDTPEGVIRIHSWEEATRWIEKHL